MRGAREVGRWEMNTRLLGKKRTKKLRASKGEGAPQLKRRGTCRLTLPTGARVGTHRPSQPRRCRKRRRGATPKPGERRFPRVPSLAARVPEPTWAYLKPLLQTLLRHSSASLSCRRTGLRRQNSLGLQHQSVSHSTEKHSPGYLLQLTDSSPRPRTRAIGCRAPPYSSIGLKRVPLSHLEGHVWRLLA